MIERITYKNKLFSIIIRTNYKEEGIKFFTPSEFSQQLGYMNRPKDYVIQPHLHRYVPRSINYTKEVLFIKSGKVRVDFYDDDKKYFESYILHTGDVILFAHGGHGFKMLEQTEIIEVKQGPYVADLDKNRFEPVNNENLIIKY